MRYINDAETLLGGITLEGEMFKNKREYSVYLLQSKSSTPPKDFISLKMFNVQALRSIVLRKRH